MGLKTMIAKTRTSAVGALSRHRSKIDQGLDKIGPGAEPKTGCRQREVFMQRGFASVLVFLTVVALPLIACAPSESRFPRNSDGSFEGTVTSVSEDNLRMTVGEETMRLDTWAVCGDSTARFISAGDTIVVFAEREAADYDAWRILTPAGEPACSR